MSDSMAFRSTVLAYLLLMVLMLGCLVIYETIKDLQASEEAPCHVYVDPLL